MGKKDFVLRADGMASTTIDLARLKAAVEAAVDI